MLLVFWEKSPFPENKDWKIEQYHGIIKYW